MGTLEWMLDEYSAWILNIQMTKTYWQEGAKNIFFKLLFLKNFFPDETGNKRTTTTKVKNLLAVNTITL